MFTDGVCVCAYKVVSLPRSLSLSFKHTHTHTHTHPSSAIQPSNPFEDALYAMQTSELDLLERYIIHDVVTPNEADVQGNTLLHYAVALGRMELITLLCNR